MKVTHALLLGLALATQARAQPTRTRTLDVSQAQGPLPRSFDLCVGAGWANVSPPKDYAKWSALIMALVQHWEKRYGRGCGCRRSNFVF